MEFQEAHEPLHGEDLSERALEAIVRSILSRHSRKQKEEGDAGELDIQPTSQ